jgi:hypothetical protein
MNPKFQPDFSAAIKFLKETKLRLKPEISVEHLRLYRLPQSVEGGAARVRPCYAGHAARSTAFRPPLSGHEFDN